MISFLILLCVLLYAYYYLKSFYEDRIKIRKGYKLLPKAPGGIPGLGHLISVGDRPHEYFHELSIKLKQPTFIIQLGWKEFVIMNKYADINASLKQQSDNFSGRWQNIFSKDLAHNCGVFFKEKQYWSEQRGFTLRVLRDFGFGKCQTEQVVRYEGNKLIQWIEQHRDQEITITDQLLIATVNTISDFIMKKEYEQDDEKIVKLLNNMRQSAQDSDVNNLFVNLYPFFESHPKLALKIIEKTNKTNIFQVINEVYEFICEITDEHRAKFSPENECTDLIDAFLLEQQKCKDKGMRESTSFIDWQLIRLITELFFAGFETTSSTLTWAFIILAKYPEVQQKMFEEISDKIGSERNPEMSDKKELNYVEAVMDEIYRISSLVPLSVPHRVYETTNINGRTIEADSIIITNLYSCHRDGEIWEKPWDFYPEHFLTEGKYTPRPQLMPFGIGKRQCLGESLARTEYFVLLVMIVQKFQIKLGSQMEDLSLFDLFRGTTGLIRGPISHKLRFISRHTDN